MKVTLPSLSVAISVVSPMSHPIALSYPTPSGNSLKVLSPVESLPRVFDRANGAQFDYVFNCGGENRYSQPEDVYRLRNHALSLTVGREAARRGVRAFIECSTATVYKGDREPRKEGDRTKPWFKLAKWKLAAEEDLQKIEGLNLCILRFPRVYGEYESGYFATGICLAKVHKYLGRELAWLYSKEMKVNTVHVKDATRAMWTAADWRASKGQIPENDTTPTLFNIVDHNDTTQGHLAEIISSTVDLPFNFIGSVASQFAKLNLDQVLDDMNEDTLQPWADMLEEKGITRQGPISPFIEKELLKDSDLAIDGKLFETTTGFQYQIPTIDSESIKTMIESYERMGWWP